MKTTSFRSLFLVFLLVPQLAVFGQQKNAPAVRGAVQITDWPASAHTEATVDSLLKASEILPLIDTLTLGYGYEVRDDQPYFMYMLDWKPAGDVYLDGKKTTLDKLKGDLFIESIVIEADVLVEGMPVTKMTIRHDSLMIEAYPGLATVSVNDLSWTTVFEDADANAARSYFLSGFKLSNAQIAAISFLFFEDEPGIARNEPTYGIPRPGRRTIYKPGVSVWIDFPVYVRRPPPRVGVVRDDDRDTAPRGDRVGRGSDIDEDRDNSDRRDINPDADRTTDRTSDRTADDEKARTDDDEGGLSDILTGKKKKDDDDEDEGELMPAAIAGVAAVVAVAFIGGTVGYYGNTTEAPIGFMTGYVERDGGVLLQVAVNNALLERSKTQEEHLVARVASFVNAFHAPIQPALGIGVHVAQADNEVEYNFSLSPGLAGNFGRLVLITGYDVMQGGVDFGVAYNFRAKR